MKVGDFLEYMDEELVEVSADETDEYGFDVDDIKWLLRIAHFCHNYLISVGDPGAVEKLAEVFGE